ncbi:MULTISPECIES: glycosyltransferase family 2 protein [Microbacterium]|uniref:glycosyltransferase family 2 protein n=1 Tax=Microbacterium TaxID=33882 RepID=UPI002789C762|nr:MULTISPECIES: glycosyltransferase [Microbacterium]MDQ1085196.1 GT2 family glycosyltransferase [Microbacterium sp. SORGH_AS_0344]MDQ1169498.1 GT2 family glycosyltransferase [Microbacterium proteolyticum]
MNAGIPGWNDRMPWVPGNRWDLLADRHPEPPRVSVVVTHYDQPRELARTLAALRHQDHPADRLEIIVADDGSPTPPVVPDGIRLVRQEDRGFRAAAARNLGAAAATGEVLCFLDADTAPEPAYIRRLTRLPALLPEAVTVGRRRHADLAGLDADVPVAEAGPAHELPEPAWLRDAYARSENLLHADDRSYRYVISAVLACSRAFFDEVGGFDESFSSYGGEDWEWAHRAWQAGAVLAHVPDAVAWHDGPDWAGRPAADRAREGNRQSLLLAQMIPVHGSRGRGLLPTTPDLVVHLPEGVPPAALFVCVDSLLAAFPLATVIVPSTATTSPVLTDPRVRLRAEGVEPDARVTLILERALVITDAAPLAAELSSLGQGEVGILRLLSADGSRVAVARSRRARRRADRWGDGVGFAEKASTPAGVHVLRDEPHVEAWVGGWGGPERFT